MALKAAAAFALLATALARADPIAPGEIDVIDGDTVRARGVVVRLVGLDAPETGARARCESERRLGVEAARRLRALIAEGSLDLADVACSCSPGTQGTQTL